MRRLHRSFPTAVAFVAVVVLSPAPAADGQAQAAGPAASTADVAIGRQMYLDGRLPSGEAMAGVYAGDVSISGRQVICGTCHRRSGLGSGEGQEVVPAVVGDMLYQPLRLPTRGPPLAPEQRPAYTDLTLKRAIREGIGADGMPLSTLMPRYALSDDDLDRLVAYLKTLSTRPGPGVSDSEIRFATIVTDDVDPATRKAVLDVYAAYVEQKNRETRHESARAVHGPWHKQWKNASYRKWLVDVWALSGPPESWPAQLGALYEKQPVFALVGGVVPTAWQPVHEFCERQHLPCVFPTTDVPVVDEHSFYNVYFSPGMALEAGIIAQHLADDVLLSQPLLQVLRADDPRAKAAADAFRRQVEQHGGRVTDVLVTAPAPLAADFWDVTLDRGAGAPLVLWLGSADMAALWPAAAASGYPGRFYLSTTLHGTTPGQMPERVRESVFLAHPYELPANLSRLLMRSTGWLKQQGIHAPDAQREQGNALLAMKMVGGALSVMRGFFVRERLLETIEHMADNAPYTSVYPRISLAPGQRFLSTGAYIAQFRPDDGTLVAVTDWRVPDSGATSRQTNGAQSEPQARAGTAGPQMENRDGQT